MIREIVIPEYELEFSFARSSGPGGQNVNKVNSKAILSWNLWSTSVLTRDEKDLVFRRLSHKFDEMGFIQIQSDESRSQLENKRFCIEKLTDLIQHALIPEKKRIKTKMPKSVKRKNAASKKRHSLKKQQRKFSESG
jgi:ribosome-associated protein